MLNVFTNAMRFAEAEQAALVVPATEPSKFYRFRRLE
jgi:hypothetical protein